MGPLFLIIFRFCVFSLNDDWLNPLCRILTGFINKLLQMILIDLYLLCRILIGFNLMMILIG